MRRGREGRGMGEGVRERERDMREGEKRGGEEEKG